ncbi:MAG: hypothetical protein LBR07_05155 [Puniceicoccales bacterium]|jgi:hypothetical protein|nr:hypothetical protein [Puniceicoccales bacterium]
MKKTVYGISFPNPDVLVRGKRRAASCGISFSAYLNQLVRRDIGIGSVFDASATSASASASNTAPASPPSTPKSARTVRLSTAPAKSAATARRAPKSRAR